MSADFNMVISPDFSPDKVSGWFMFSTWLQKKLGKTIHVVIPNSRNEFIDFCKNNKADIVYCNPFDSSELIRGLNFKAITKPKQKHDEVVIAVKEGSNIKSIEDLKGKSGAVVSVTENFDVNMIGLRMIEPANLKEDDVVFKKFEGYPAVAKSIIKEEALFGFFLAEIFHQFSSITKKQLQILVESRIDDVNHVVLLNQNSEVFSLMESIQQNFVSFGQNQNEIDIGEALGIMGFEIITQEEAEFMIDLIETLKD